MRSKLCLVVMLAGAIALQAAGVRSASAGGAALADARNAARVAAADAIGTAERETNGRALKLDWEQEGGTSVYEIESAAGDTLFEIDVDAATGGIVKRSDEGKLGERKRARIEAILQSPTTLAQAVTTAEAATGGKVMEAEYDDDRGRPVIEVEVVKADGSRQEVIIDAATGTPTPAAGGREGGKR